MSDCKSSMPNPGEFGWNELLSNDIAKSSEFYSSLFPWKVIPFAPCSGSGEAKACDSTEAKACNSTEAKACDSTENKSCEGKNYNLFILNDRPIGGLMPVCDPNQRPMWVSYVVVPDVDATAKHAEEMGAKLCVPPFDVPSVGRICVFADPQGAVIGIWAPAK